MKEINHNDLIARIQTAWVLHAFDINTILISLPKDEIIWCLYLIEKEQSVNILNYIVNKIQQFSGLASRLHAV